MKFKSVYVFEILLFIFVIALRLFLIRIVPNYYEFINVVFWAFSAFVLYRMIGFQKDRNMSRGSAIQVVIISLMLYILIAYLSGLYFGFLRNSYSLDLISILKNIYPIIFMVVFQELIRWMISAKSKKNIRPLIVLTTLYIILDLVLTFNSSINNGLKLFVYISKILLPNVSRHILCSYLCYRVSFVPGLIMRLFFGIYIYILPIFPDYGDYIEAVVGILLPFVAYIFISRIVQRADKDKPTPIKKSVWYLYVPFISILLFIVTLVSGIFKYQVMAIGSGSMEPVYYRGDAVLFEKIENPDVVQVGEVLVFIHDGKYITHRVTKISRDDDSQLVFKTKGDNNKKEDKYEVHANDVVGIVKLRIKYIGLPTIWFSELVS